MPARRALGPSHGYDNLLNWFLGMHDGCSKVAVQLGEGEVVEATQTLVHLSEGWDILNRLIRERTEAGRDTAKPTKLALGMHNCVTDLVALTGRIDQISRGRGKPLEVLRRRFPRAPPDSAFAPELDELAQKVEEQCACIRRAFLDALEWGPL